MKTLVTLLLLTSTTLCAQTKITGNIVNATSNSPLMGATVVERNKNNGTITDENGYFEMSVANLPTTLTLSYSGFKERVITLQDTNHIQIALVEGFELDEVIVGSRSLLKDYSKTALPIRVITSDMLQASKEISLDKAIQYIEPSFNSVNLPVSDATSILDPFELRSMGSSRTLVLIDGKRKNPGPLVYTFSTVGRGETGVDISAIPIEAVERIEVLRDGASAQYGSDAIAGVINIILKKNKKSQHLNLTTGITSQGDGEFVDFSMYKGTKLANNGYFNYTVKFSKSEVSNRSSDVNAQGEYLDFVHIDPNAPGSWPEHLNSVGEVIAHNESGFEDIQEFLSKYPDAKNINGPPEKATVHFLVNGGFDLKGSDIFYYNAGYNYKKLNSFANYRTPYWRTTDWGLLTPHGQAYEGYLPEFNAELHDYHATIGMKTEKNGWKTDASFTTGGNTQRYTVTNSVNRSETVFQEDGITPKYQENSPIYFNSGGPTFSHYIANLDLSKLLFEKLSFAAGAEFRIENYEITAGGLASWEGGGSDSFSGFTSNDAFASNRYNFGAYLSLSSNITDFLLLDGSIRLEDYSDFGSKFIWKLSSRIKLSDNGFALRGALSTGFKAPSLQQRHLTKLQYSFIAGEGIQKELLLSNTSSEAKQLGVPELQPESAFNLTVGLEYNPTPELDISLDYYNTKIEDRIVLGNRIGGTEAGNTALDNFLEANEIRGFNFFSNALDTRTSGLDFIANYTQIPLHLGVLNLNLSANYTLQNEAISPITSPEIIEETGQTVFNKEMQALLLTARPEYKVLFGMDYQVSDFKFHLGNNYIGPALFRNNGMDSNLAVVFDPKVLTDLGCTYNINEKTAVFLDVNNLFNIVPEWNFKALNPEGALLLADPDQRLNQSNLITFNQRYTYTTYDGSHFNYFGTRFVFGLNYSF